MTIPIFKIIAESRYIISSDGNLYSSKNFGIINLKAYKDTNGYLQLRINSKMFKVARLVAEHFLSDWNPDLQVNHKNGIKTDNRVENLEMCTGSENHIHAYKMGLMVPKRGELNGNSKLTQEEVNFIRDKLNNIPATKVALMFGVNRKTILAVRHGKTWRF